MNGLTTQINARWRRDDGSRQDGMQLEFGNIK